MNRDMSAARPPMPDKPKKNNTWLVIVLVVLVICCLCIVVGFVGWNYGDQILKTLGLAQ
jgi:hypothetical protein